jgi:hypothetical protein
MKKVFYTNITQTYLPGATGIWQGNIVEPARKFRIGSVVWDYAVFLLAGAVRVQKIPYDQMNLFHAQLNLLSGNPATPFTQPWQGLFAAPAATYSGNFRYLTPGSYEVDNLIVWNNLLANIEFANFDLVNSYSVNVSMSILIEYLR